MKLIFVTDTHFRTNTPVNRTDDILESLLKKWEWVCSYAAKINADILHGGDLFHTPSVPDYVAYRVIQITKRYERRIYFVIGNHDVSGGNTARHDYSKIGLMAEYPWFHLIHNEPVFFKDVIVCGYDFSKDMECPETIDPVRDKKRITEVSGLNGEKRPKPIICMIHSMLVDEPELVIDGKRKTIHWANVQANCDLILCGHFHPGWEGIKTLPLTGTMYINPGAMTRQEASRIDMVREPKIVVIDAHDGILDIKFKVIPHNKKVFNEGLIDAKKHAESEKNRFIEAINSIRDEDMASGNVLKMLDNIGSSGIDKDLLSPKIITMCKEKIQTLMEK